MNCISQLLQNFHALELNGLTEALNHEIQKIKVLVLRN